MEQNFPIFSARKIVKTKKSLMGHLRAEMVIKVKIIVVSHNNQLYTV